MQEVVFWVCFFGLWCGIVARVALPFLRKVYQGTVTGWDKRYTYTAIAGSILTFIIAILALNQMTIPEPPPEGITGVFLFQVWAGNFVVGFGMLSLINEILAMGKPKVTEYDQPQKR